MKVLLVGSSGGHLDQLLQLRPWLLRHEEAWATFRKPDALAKLEGCRTHWLRHPTNRNLLSLAYNFVVALRVMLRERPDVVISTGAGGAIPFFLLAPPLRCTTVWIEVIDRLEGPSLTGRIVSRWADVTAVQWPAQREFYRDALVIGPLY